MKWTGAAIVIGAVLLAGCQARQATVPAPPAAETRAEVHMRQWGQETLEMTRSDC